MLSISAASQDEFRMGAQITGTLLNLAHYTCPNCSTAHALFGAPETFRATARRLGLDVLGELGLVTAVGADADAGVPFMLGGKDSEATTEREWRKTMANVAEKVAKALKSE
jgi:ATP-binding protein involved in chromosome partitioning